MKDDLVVLETENLFLKKFVRTDFRNFCALHQNKTIMKYFDGGAKTLEQSRTRFNEIMKHQEKYGFSYYAIFLKETNTFIGQMGLYYNYDMTVNLCYALLEEYHGYDYSTEAAIAVLEEGFNRLNFSVISVMSAPENYASRHLIEKLGGIKTRNITFYSGMKVYGYSITRYNFYKALADMKKYRKAVGAILINKDKQIYAFQRCDFPDTWQCPEGGLEQNEKDLDGIYRELYEEIGIEKNKLKLLSQTKGYIKYDFADGHSINGYDGQRKKFFLFEFLGNENDFNYTKTNEKQEFLQCKLVSKDECINLVPQFKKDLYEKVLKEFKI